MTPDHMKINEGDRVSDQKQDQDFSITMMFHPSHDVADLDEAERWYERVFGAPSTPLSSVNQLAEGAKPDRAYPRNYSTFTPIRDVLFDTIDPSLYVFHGAQQLPKIDEPHLRMLVWYVDGMDGLYRTLRRNGVRLMNQVNEIHEGEEAPESYASKMTLMFTVPEDAGLRYALFPADFHIPFDPRIQPGFELSQSPGTNPLGLDRCSHHTILTDKPKRAIRFHELLGARTFHEGRNALLGATSTYMHLADSTVEIAVPDEGTDAWADWRKRAPNDSYHALTWKVEDLAHAERHLTAQGVRIRSRSDDMLITDPKTSLGIPWAFTTALVPGDPRQTESVARD